jgi:hypothetical protein
MMYKTNKKGKRRSETFARSRSVLMVLIMFVNISRDVTLAGDYIKKTRQMEAVNLGEVVQKIIQRYIAVYQRVITPHSQ